MSDENPTFTIDCDGCRYSVEWPRLSGDDSQQDPRHAAVYTTMDDLVGHIEPLTANGFQTETDVIAAAQAFLQALVEEAGDECDMQDRIARLAAEAQQRADVAGVQVAWQEGRAHGLREAAAAVADTRTLRDDIRDYIETLEKRIADKEEMLQKLAARSSEYSVGYYEGSRCALFQASEDLRDLLDADEPEEGDDE